MGPVLIVLAVVLGSLAIWVAALVDISRKTSSAFERVGRARGSVFVLVLLTGMVGGAYYWLVIRREITRAHSGSLTPES